MKKFLTAMLALVMSASMAFAQQQPAAQQKPATSQSAPHMKKDGTPDKRFKENKESKEGPKKKDGTADMRYKVNKEKAKEKPKEKEKPKQKAA